MSGVAIIDAGYGNLASVRTAFARIGAQTVLTSDPEEVETCERLVLPGVGNAALAMDMLHALDLIAPLKRRTGPLLGICLGMQLLFEATDELDTKCLGLIPGKVSRLPGGSGIPVPHMGWTRIEDALPDTGLERGDYVYFAHSFACADTPATSARVTYGLTIPAAVRSGQYWGAQFHPERSAAAGSMFLKAFCNA